MSWANSSEIYNLNAADRVYQWNSSWWKKGEKKLITGPREWVEARGIASIKCKSNWNRSNCRRGQVFGGKITSTESKIINSSYRGLMLIISVFRRVLCMFINLFPSVYAVHFSAVCKTGRRGCFAKRFAAQPLTVPAPVRYLPTEMCPMIRQIAFVACERELERPKLPLMTLRGSLPERKSVYEY